MAIYRYDKTLFKFIKFRGHFDAQSWQFIVTNSREAIAAIIGDIVVFLQFKEFELYWGAVFF